LSIWGDSEEEKKRLKGTNVKKKLTSTAITLYASVSDNAPGNDERRYRVLGLSADRADNGDTGLVSDLDRWRATRSGLTMPSTA
jgi:hypothetical protein